MDEDEDDDDEEKKQEEEDKVDPKYELMTEAGFLKQIPNMTGFFKQN